MSMFKSAAIATGIKSYDVQIKHFSFPPVSEETKWTRQLRGAVALSMIESANTSTEMMSFDDAIGYILTVNEILAPGSSDWMRANGAGQLTSRSLPIDVESMIMLFREQKDKDDDESESKSEGMVELFSLKVGDDIVTMDHWDAGYEAVCARWGIEMYVLGKAPTAQNMRAFKENRPDAVKRVFKIVGDENRALHKKTLPSLSNMMALDRALFMYNPVKLGLANFWIDKILDGPSNTGERSFLITFSLVDGTGLGGAYHIAMFLKAYPIARTYPGLGPIIEEFDRAMEIYEREPPATRGFVKVRFGSSYKVFSSFSSGFLLDIALAYGSQTNPKLENYKNIDDSRTAIHEFNEWLVERNIVPIRGQFNRNSKNRITEL